MQDLNPEPFAPIKGQQNGAEELRPRIAINELRALRKGLKSPKLSTFIKTRGNAGGTSNQIETSSTTVKSRAKQAWGEWQEIASSVTIQWARLSIDVSLRLFPGQIKFLHLWVLLSWKSCFSLYMYAVHRQRAISWHLTCTCNCTGSEFP